MMQPQRKLHPWRTGFAGSAILHVVLLVILLFRVAPDLSRLEPPVVYSITVEGGKQLGGISQIAKDPKQELKVAKAAPEPTPPPKVVEQKKVEEPPKREEKKAPPAAEVSTAEKKAEKKPAKKEDPKKEKKPVVDDYQSTLQKYLGNSSKSSGKGFGAAAYGEKGTGGGVVESPEFIAYRDSLEQHIKSGWRWADTSRRYVAKVRFALSPQGKISDITLVMPSGSKLFDEAAVRAVVRADPAPVAPASVAARFAVNNILFDSSEGR